MNKQELLTLGKSFWIQLKNVEKIILKKTELTKEQFFLTEQIVISKIDLEELRDQFRKVSFGYPLEYILESAEFYGLDFYVDKRCLIPRDDTEIMVDEAIKTIEENNCIYIDIWTWSWAIPISIVDNIWKNIDKAFAVDIWIEALEVAKINIQKHNLVDEIELLESDLLETIFPLLKREGARGWVITANLPYIKDEDYWNMDKQVILHEPSIALYWWKKTGFELYEKLISHIIQIKKNKTKGIVLFIEIGFDQKEVALAYLTKNNLEHTVFKDNRWVERCIKVVFQ